MDFSSRRIADVIVAAPVGQVDHPNAQRLEQSLAPLLADAAANKLPVVLDFQQVTYISSMGLRVLMMAGKQMRSRAPLAVVALQPAVAEIFAIARFNHVVEVFPSLRDALLKLSPQALAALDAGTAR